jgi:hypothetical protein
MGSFTQKRVSVSGKARDTQWRVLISRKALDSFQYYSFLEIGFLCGPKAAVRPNFFSVIPCIPISSI